jgi:hypothetical protein
MPTDDRLLTRETLDDVLVNLVPLGVLATFVAVFLLSAPYPLDPLYVTVHVALIAIPALVLLVFTYYALRAVTEAERGGEGLPPGYSAADAEVETTRTAADD